MITKIASLFNDEKNPNQARRALASLFKCIATSQVFFFVLMADLWFRNLTLNSLVVDPRY